MKETSRRTTRRYFRRVGTPRPWWPWGAAPLAGLVVLFLFGALFMAPRIEAEVREQVSQRVDGAGFEATGILGDGQGITVEAPLRPDQVVYMEAVAASTRCDTWAGKLTCPSTVDVRRRDMPAAAPARPHRFIVEKTDDAVRLTGEVPSLAEHDRILGVAGEYFDEVTDELTISNERAGDFYTQGSNQALAVASHLTGGKTTWSGTTLSVEGSANADAMTNLRERFGEIGDESLQGEFNVRALQDAQQCNLQFAGILESGTIRFRTASAIIDSGNEALLDSLAEVARNCPGALTIEGHTDSQGDADMNQALSLARATAVRDALADRGIDLNRLQAVGFGESRPIAGNNTIEGRATNRRIAISIDDTK